jgi:cell pole-organizing protein PopZ
MSDQSPQEPTMEEILASIRRIISEDDAPAEEAAPAPEPEPEAEFVAEEAPAEDDVLELTDPIEPPAPVESMGDIDVYSPEPGPADAQGRPHPGRRRA